MIRPHLVNQRATLGKRDEVVWIADRWRINAINIGWQESLFTGAANNPPRLRCGSRIAYQHLDPIKHKRLRPEEGCASGIKNVRGHVIAVRPDAQLRIIEKIGSEIKAIAVPGSSRVPGLRHGDALRHWNANTGELADDPAVSQLIIDHYRIAAAAEFADAAKARPE